MFQTFSVWWPPVKITGKINKIFKSTTLKIRTKRKTITKSWAAFPLKYKAGLKCSFSVPHLIASSEIINKFYYFPTLCSVLCRINKCLYTQEIWAAIILVTCATLWGSQSAIHPNTSTFLSLYNYILISIKELRRQQEKGYSYWYISPWGCNPQIKYWRWEWKEKYL